MKVLYDATLTAGLLFFHFFFFNHSLQMFVIL